MALWALSALPANPRGVRWVRSKWRYRVRKFRRKKALASFAKKLASEHGSVESALVVIPLMALFLISFQLVLIVNSRNIQSSFAQSSAAHNAISGNFEKGDRIIDLNSPDFMSHLNAVVTTRIRPLPNLVPGLSGENRSTHLHGFSIIESQ
jgi:hypothetical protein